MTKWTDSQTMRRHASELVEAVRADEDLPDETWEALWAAASPQQRRTARLLADPTLAPHGVPSTYTNWGCRCDDCRAARNTGRTADSARSDFSDPAPGAGKPYEELTLTEKAVRTVQEFGYDAVSDKARELYDAWKAAQTDDSDVI